MARLAFALPNKGAHSSKVKCVVMIKERTQAGIHRAKIAGKRFGRPSTLNTEQRAKVMQELASGLTVSDVARQFKTSRQTILRARESAALKTAVT